MITEIKDLIRKNKNTLVDLKNERSVFVNKVHFCSKHNFEEEVRIANLKLQSIDMIIFDYEKMINDLEKIINSKKKEDENK